MMFTCKFDTTYSCAKEVASQPEGCEVISYRQGRNVASVIVRYPNAAALKAAVTAYLGDAGWLESDSAEDDVLAYMIENARVVPQDEVVVVKKDLQIATPAVAS